MSCANGPLLSPWKFIGYPGVDRGLPVDVARIWHGESQKARMQPYAVVDLGIGRAWRTGKPPGERRGTRPLRLEVPAGAPQQSLAGSLHRPAALSLTVAAVPPVGVGWTRVHPVCGVDARSLLWDI
jgi:hypothetical protein